MKLLIKLGGTLLDDKASRKNIASQAAAAAAEHRTVVVHGGGKQLSRYLKTYGIESEFRHGLRVTSPEILTAVLRILAGTVNHELVAALGEAGARAVGLSGIDAGMVLATPLAPDLGAVGKVEEVNAELLDLLTENGYLPAVACVAGGRGGEVYNVNADQMAVAAAGGFGADQLIFLTDVEGVLDENQRRIAKLTPADAEDLIQRGVAKGGMEAKLRAAAAGVEQGIGQVRIVRGAEPDVVSRVLGGEDLGTTLVKS